MKDAETGQRGFVITAEETYLEPYNAALAAGREDGGQPADPDLRQPAPAASDRRGASRSSRAKLAELKRTIEMRRTQGFEPTQKVVLSNEGKNVMDDLRRVLGAMDQEERDAPREYEATAPKPARAARRRPSRRAPCSRWSLVSRAGFVITRSLNHAARERPSRASGARRRSCRRPPRSRRPAVASKSSATSEVSTTIRELLATSRQIAESAQRVARIAEETAGGARAGDQTVQRAQEAISGIKRQVDHDRRPHARARQEVAAGRRHSRDHQRARRADQHPRDQRDDRGGGRRARAASASPSSPTRSASSPIASAGRPRRSATVIEDIRAAVNTTVMATESGTKAVDAGARQFGDVDGVVQADRRPRRDDDRGGPRDRAQHQAADDRRRAGQRRDLQRRAGDEGERGELGSDAADGDAARGAVARPREAHPAGCAA